MNPRDVISLLQTLTKDLSPYVPPCDNGPLLISKDDTKIPRERLETIAKQWMELEREGYDAIPQEAQDARESIGIYGKHRSYRTSVGISVSDICVEIEDRASDTKRNPEVREILNSLIAEQKLPFKIFNRAFSVIIIPENPVQYRNTEMIVLDTLLENENLDVQVRHSGFGLHRFDDKEYDNPDLSFLQIQEMAKSLQAELKKHNLKVCLLHDGFVLEKKREIEIDVMETKELALRLSVMTGINFRGGSGYGTMLSVDEVPPGWTNEINWKTVRISTSSPYY